MENNNPEEIKKIQQKILELEALAKQYMTIEAISRYGSLKSAHQEKAIQAIIIIAQLASENKIKNKITDEEFKQLLIKMEPEKKETKIKWR